MSEEFQERRLKEPLDADGNEAELSRSGKSNIRYTRDSLLEFNEAEACRRLPGDFDLLVLRQLDGASNGLTEYGNIACNSSGSFTSTQWSLGIPGERKDDKIFFLNKENCSEGNCRSGRNDIKCQHLPLEFENYAGILGPKIQNKDPFQLRKSENPYRPPHCIKMPQPLDSSSGLQMEFSGNPTETEQGFAMDGHTGTHSLDSSFHDSQMYNRRSWGIDSKLELGRTNDNNLFDDFWSEILEIIQLQQEPRPSLAATQDTTPYSEVEICLPGKDTLILGNGRKSRNHHQLTEIGLPDEDSLISVDDEMIISPIPMPTLERRDCVEADKATPNAARKLRNYPETLYATKPDDRSTALSFSGPFCEKRMLPKLPYSQASDIFGPEKPALHVWNDQMSLLPTFTRPTLDWYSCSDFHHCPNKRTVLTGTGTNDSLVQYSLWQQPKICPEQLNHLTNDSLVQYSLWQQPNFCPEQLDSLLMDTSPVNPAATPDLNAVQFLHLTPQQSIFQGFGTSTAGGFGDDASGFWHNQH